MAEADTLRDVPAGDAQGNMLLLVQKPDNLADFASDIQALKARDAPPWIVFMARTLNAAEIADSFALGGDGYLLEEISPAALVESLNLVILGEKVFPSQLVGLLADADWAGAKANSAHAHSPLLSDRELEIVKWLVRGAPNKMIAAKTSITEATVKVHIKAILKKIGVHNRTQAAIWALQQGFLDQESR
jgi:two-component system nitrate/nitrite response regulator NarL